MSLHEQYLMTVQSRCDDRPVCEDLDSVEGLEEGWCVDDMSGKELQPALVQEARAQELDIVQQM